MNKQEIQNEIKETRQKLEQLEQRLNEPEKFQFQGGEFVFTPYSIDHVHCDDKIIAHKIVFRAKSRQDCKRLAKHLKNQAIIWQVAERVNNGWIRSGGVNEGAYEVFQRAEFDKFSFAAARMSGNGIFRDKEAAKKACDILNNQDTGYEK